MTLFNKRFSLTADYYYKVTDPLLIKVSTPLSSGTATYMTNAGEQVSQGFTASVSYYVFQNFEKRFSWMVRANVRTQKNRIDKIGNKLSTLNASGKGENTVRYYDGADPDDIWAVKSAGIDPSNGKELFYAKDGSYTYDFSYDDEVVCAETTPMSSRFVQEENVLTLESIYVGYEFYDGWIKKLGLSSLKIQASMRDVFRASTIRSERGIAYPFARSMEAGLSFNF